MARCWQLQAAIVRGWAAAFPGAMHHETTAPRRTPGQLQRTTQTRDSHPLNDSQPFTNLPGRGAGASSSAGVHSSMHSHQSAIPAGLSTFSYTRLGRDESQRAACLSCRTCCTWSWSYEEVCVSARGSASQACRFPPGTLRAPIYLAAASGRPGPKGLAMPVGCRLLVAAASLGRSPKLSRCPSCDINNLAPRAITTKTRLAPLTLGRSTISP